MGRENLWRYRVVRVRRYSRDRKQHWGRFPVRLLILRKESLPCKSSAWKLRNKQIPSKQRKVRVHLPKQIADFHLKGIQLTKAENGFRFFFSLSPPSWCVANPLSSRFDQLNGRQGSRLKPFCSLSSRCCSRGERNCEVSQTFLSILQIGAYTMLNCMRTRPNDSKCKYYSKHLKLYNNPTDPNRENRLLRIFFLRWFCLSSHCTWRKKNILSLIEINTLEEIR